MKNQRSRLLQVVVAVLLMNPALDSRADTYDLSGVRATFPDFGEDEDRDYFEWGYDNWDFNDYYEPSDSGDGELDEEKKAECDAIAAKVGASCDLENPPLLTTNGCGSAGISELVPDFLLINGAPVFHLGPIFQEACNEHDRCYGEYPSDQEACDLSLNTDMISYAKSNLTERQWMVYGLFVRSQAMAYSSGLQAPFIKSISGEAFKIGQMEGACRVYSTKAYKAGCFN